MATRAILIVDPDQTLRATLSYILKKEMHQVATAETLAEALELLLRSHFSLIITEAFDQVRVDRFDPSFLHTLKLQVGITPIILFSRYGSQGTVSAGDFGLAEVLPKPFDVDEVLRKVSKVLNKTTPASSHRRLDENTSEQESLLDPLRKAQEKVAQCEVRSQELMDDAKRLSEDNEQLRRELEECKRAEESLNFLAEAGRVLASSLEYEDTLKTVLSLAVPTLGDWCSLEIRDDYKGIRRTEMVHVIPSKNKLIESYQCRHRSEKKRRATREEFRELLGIEIPSEQPRWEQLVGEAVSTKRAVLLSELDDSNLFGLARDGDHLQLLRRLGLKSAIIVPLVVRGVVLGAFTLGVTELDRRFVDADLAPAEAFALRAGLALNNARLYKAEGRSRQDALQTADRIITLQAITLGLMQAITVSEVADVILSQGVSTLGASAGSIVLLTDDGSYLEVIGATGYPQELLDRWRRFSVNEPVPLAEAARTGEHIFVDSPEMLAGRSTAAAEGQAITGNRALAALPLSDTSGKIIGALGLSYAKPRTFSGDDRSFIISLAWQCSLALDRALLFESEQRACRESQAERALLEAVVRQMPEGVIIAEAPSGKLILGNQQVEEIWRRPFMLAVGVEQYHEYEGFHIDGRPYRPEDWPLARSVRNGQIVINEEINFARGDGTRGTMRVSSTPVRDPEGRIVAGVAVFDDITELKAAEENLRSSQRLLQQVLDTLPVGVWVLDANGLLTMANPEGRRIWGGARYIRMEQFGEYKGWWLKTGKAVEAHEWAGARAIQKGETSLNEGIEIEAFDGTRKIISNSAVPIRDEAGRIMGAVVVNLDITERRRDEEALRESEERFRALVTASSEVLYRMSPDWSEMRQLHSRGFLANTERPSRTWLQEYIHPDDQAQVTAAINEAIRTKSIFELEHRVRRVDGSLGWTFSRAVPLLDANGDIVEWFGAASDITERKLAELERERMLQEIEAQRRLFQVVVDNVPAGIALLRPPTFVHEFVNPAFQAIVPGIQLTGRTVGDLWPEFRSQLVPVLEKVWRGGEPYFAVDRVFYIQRTPDAAFEEAHFTFSYVPLRGPKGRIEAILVFAVETTEQVRARKRIEDLAKATQRRAAELQGVLDNMVDAVLACDANGRVTTVNRAGLELMGVDSLEQLKSPLTEFPRLHSARHLDGRPLAAQELPLLRALKGETILLEDEIVYDPGTQRDVYIRTSAAPIRVEQGNIVGAVSVVRDVTALTELDRLKDELISVAAHELKTPVTIMKAHAQALLRTVADIPPPRRKMLEAIDRGSDRIDRIVGDLLDISRLLAGHLELTIASIDLPQMAEDVVERMSLTTTKHTIRVVKAEPVVAQGDRDRLEQVLIDLLDNAIKYSPKGGDIDVAVKARDHEAVVSVSDHGIGIPREKQKRIFERFYRAHTGTPYDYGGMGVGLFISKEIIRRHGGEAWFKSEEGKGSTFCFCLPSGDERVSD